MAKKKEVKDIEALTEIQEAIQEAQVAEVLEEKHESIDTELADKEVEEVVDTQIVEPKVEAQETFSDKDIVTFVNKRGELRVGQYGYISKRGYKAIEKYKSKK